MTQDGSDRLASVQDNLHQILSELDAEEMTADERIRVEKACMKINAAFSGSDPDEIYRDLDTETE